MGKKKNDIDAKLLLAALHVADEALEGYPMQATESSAMLEGSVEDLEACRSEAARLTRDLADLAVRLSGAITRARTEERIAALSKKGA